MQTYEQTSQKGSSMKLKHLIALVGLALGLASGGVAATSIAGGRVGGGDIHTLADGAAGGSGGEGGRH
jgi:hypothetical protein